MKRKLNVILNGGEFTKDAVSKVHKGVMPLKKAEKLKHATKIN